MRGARLDYGFGIGGLEDRLLLLMAGALAEDAVKPQADEQGNQGKDYDNGQALRFQIRCLDARNIVRCRATFKVSEKQPPPLRPI